MVIMSRCRGGRQTRFLFPNTAREKTMSPDLWAKKSQRDEAHLTWKLPWLIHLMTCCRACLPASSDLSLEQSSRGLNTSLQVYAASFGFLQPGAQTLYHTETGQSCILLSLFCKRTPHSKCCIKLLARSEY